MYSKGAEPCNPLALLLVAADWKYSSEVTRVTTRGTVDVVSCQTVTVAVHIARTRQRVRHICICRSLEPGQ